MPRLGLQPIFCRQSLVGPFPFADVDGSDSTAAPIYTRVADMKCSEVKPRCFGTQISDLLVANGERIKPHAFTTGLFEPFSFAAKGH
ncbi:hypothetical protein ACOSQ2_005629 [Xanthoceras sorbifolium]